MPSVGIAPFSDAPIPGSPPSWDQPPYTPPSLDTSGLPPEYRLTPNLQGEDGDAPGAVDQDTPEASQSPDAAPRQAARPIFADIDPSRTGNEQSFAVPEAPDLSEIPANVNSDGTVSVQAATSNIESGSQFDYVQGVLNSGNWNLSAGVETGTLDPMGSFGFASSSSARSFEATVSGSINQLGLDVKAHVDDFSVETILESEKGSYRVNIRFKIAF